MKALAAEIGVGEIPVADDPQVRLAELGKAVEEVFERPAGETLEVGKAIEGWEGVDRVALEDGACTRDPVRFVGVDEVTDDFEGTPGGGALVCRVPGGAAVPEEGVEGGRGPFEDLQRFSELERHRTSRIPRWESWRRRDPYRPPARSRNAPVVYEASSERSQRMARATSSAVPPRRIGMAGRSRSIRPGSPPLAWISVWMNAGRTAFTRIPSTATSCASPMVKVSMAPLDAA